MFPALFVSHGSPTLPFDDVVARDFLSGLGRDLPRPQVILAVSAHWETAGPSITAAAQNATIHDFRGFPRALYDLRYDAPGAPQVAAALQETLHLAGIEGTLNDRRGLDHGAWVPLMLMYPQADIPVLQLSIQPQLGVAHHFALGRALRSFREHGLVLASGGFVHNLMALDWNGGPEPEWSVRFSDWMDLALLNGQHDDLVAYRGRAPQASWAHPSEDHIMPLFVAAGAGDTARRLHKSTVYGTLRMDAYAFD